MIHHFKHIKEGSYYLVDNIHNSFQIVRSTKYGYNNIITSFYYTKFNKEEILKLAMKTLVELEGISARNNQ